MSREGAVPSPCVRRCTLNAEGTLCLGCKRSLTEIMTWQAMTADEKRAVVARIAKLPPASRISYVKWNG